MNSWEDSLDLHTPQVVHVVTESIAAPHDQSDPRNRCRASYPQGMHANFLVGTVTWAYSVLKY